MGGTINGVSPRLDEDISFWEEGWEKGVPRVIDKMQDRAKRIKALGNSIVPQVAYQIMMAIKENYGDL